jgi:hypothetical protein
LFSRFWSNLCVLYQMKKLPPTDLHHIRSIVFNISNKQTKKSSNGGQWVVRSGSGVHADMQCISVPATHQSPEAARAQQQHGPFLI